MTDEKLIIGDEAREYWENKRKITCSICKKNPSDGYFYLRGEYKTFNPDVCSACARFIGDNIDDHIEKFFKNL